MKIRFSILISVLSLILYNKSISTEVVYDTTSGVNNSSYIAQTVYASADMALKISGGVTASNIQAINICWLLGHVNNSYVEIYSDNSSSLGVYLGTLNYTSSVIAIGGTSVTKAFYTGNVNIPPGDFWVRPRISSGLGDLVINCYGNTQAGIWANGSGRAFKIISGNYYDFSTNPCMSITISTTVISVSPASGNGVGSTAITITGSGFNGATGVTIGGVPASSVVVVNDTSITALTPSGTTSLGSIIVTTPGGTNGNAPNYTDSLGNVYAIVDSTHVKDSNGNTYTFTDSRVYATITGFTYAASPAIIPASLPNGHPVTSIGNNAFAGSAIRNVIIPSSVTSIGTAAFNSCASLLSVDIPSSVTSIGDSAFQYCSSMGSVNIPSSVTSIGDSAFYHCTSLSSVAIPSNVTIISRNAFLGCTNLSSVTIPIGVTSIGDGAFQSCTSLSYVIIPSSVTSIGFWPFYGCTSLNSVIFNEIVAPTISWGSFSSIKSGAKGFYPYVSTGYTASTIQSTSVSGQLAMISSTTVTSALTASGTVGSAFTYTITGAGGSGNVLPNSFTASPLPSGLSIDLSNGRISGTPTAAGIYNVTIGFQDAMSYPVASATLVITIPAPTPTLTFATPIAASVYIGSTLTNLATSSIPPPSGGAITYSSANTAVATVSSSGVVTGVSSGTSVITATQAAAVGVNASTLQTYTITVSAAPAPVIPSKIAAGISITNTTQTYTGKPLSVTTSLSPSTLSAAVVYYPGFNVPTDAGTYYVLVNVVDNTYYGSQSSVLTILPAAQTVSLATPSTLSIGVPVSLSAISTTNGPIVYSVVSGNTTLTGSTLTALDSNPVTIKATQAGTNNYQSASATVTLSATPVAIAITSQPTAKLNILQGNPFTLSVTATGTAPTYQWYFGSTPITGATSSTYTLASTAISNSGSYTCVVTNSAGSITSSPSVIGIFAPVSYTHLTLPTKRIV